VKRIVVAALVALPLFAQEPIPTTPPAPSAPREAKLPQPSEKTLENGLRVIVVPKHDVPLVAARLLVRAGRAADPAGKAGVAALTATVLTQGTKTKSAEEIARGVEALGATLESDSQWDSSTIDLSVMSSNLPKALEFVADVAANATFAKDEFDRERAQAIDALQVSLSQPRSIAGAVATRLVYGDRPYGRSSTPETLAKVTRNDVAAFHRANYIPQRSVLVMAGDIKAEEAFALALNAFGSWKRGTTEAAPAPHATKPMPGRIVVVDMPDAGSSAVVVARRGIRRVDPGYMQAMVANSVLGGGYSSRLNQEIRIKRGLSYGAGSAFEPRIEPGPFTARTETKHETADESASIIVAEMKRLGAEEVAEAELGTRKAALIGDFAQSLETTAGIVDQVSILALHELPLSETNRYISGVQSVKSAELRKFASTNLGGDASVVIVGDAKQFVDPLRKEFGEVEVIRYEDLDLNSPTLRVRLKKQ
jgi:zinc protease